MKAFEFYLKVKSVKRQLPDMNLASATAKGSADRIELAKSILRTQKPKYALENAYEALRECIDAILFSEGYKSYSHEASIAYLQKLGFSESEIYGVDRLRRMRNGIKYYGEDISSEQAKEALSFSEAILKKLRKIRKL